MCTSAYLKLRPVRHGRQFYFGEGCQTNVDSVELRIPTPEELFIPIAMGVVREDIPLLQGLDVMTKAAIIIDLHRT